MECQYPDIAALTARNKGCKCERCLTARKEYDAAKYQRRKDAQLAKAKEYNASPRGRAINTLKNNKTQARLKGYEPIRATIEEVMAIQEQTECCHCGSSGPLETDHCHETGALRGMLCLSCNKKDVLNGN